jgi:outer membrane PBP1 activator LpoA protein
MNRIQEIKSLLQDGKLNQAEIAIQDCYGNLSSAEKEEFETLLNEISVRHYQILAGKAVLSKNESLLSLCIKKLREKNVRTEGLQNSLNQIKSEKRAKQFQKALVIIFGLISITFFGLLMLL